MYKVLFFSQSGIIFKSVIDMKFKKNIMKNKIITTFVLGIFISIPAFSQDTIHTYPVQKDSVLITQPANTNNKKIISESNQNKILDEPPSQSTYYDTRLGSSSPLYDTYEKNDYGAGAITTNPDK